MKRNARGHLKAAIKLYREEGSTDFGSYRDIITDTLHLLKADKAVHKLLPDKGNGDSDYYFVCGEGWEVFQEECENAEIAIIDKAARENKLPLLVKHKWEYPDAEKYYQERLIKL